MMVWAVLIAMTAVAFAIILLPLLRSRDAAPDSAAFDVEVYKDQLTQTISEYDRGLLSADQATAAKTEISRRLLEADARRGDEIIAASTGGRWAVAAPIIVLAPALALGFYAWRGSPDLPGQPYVERGVERAAANAQRDNTLSLDAAAKKLADQLKKNPANYDGWLLLARTYMNIQRYGDAADAFGHALGLKSGDADLRSAYGEALTFAADGAVTPAARTVFMATKRQSPNDPRARFYLALALFRGGDKQKALDQWVGLMRDSTANAPWLPAVRQRIAEAAKALNLDVATVTPQPLPAQSAGPAVTPAPGTPTGPTAAQMQAA
ncbi:MAG: c-type cytochrome biogenesis protein CcmI, partial [Alphaproteobacteria bacterium]|nr:c-type cytochrome biogenesis protein CcmI [Alphaproteobacteria bacterium]